jgi:adenylylsulfate kinase
MKRILVMGLPGAGKTTLSDKIVENLRISGKTVTWLNADDIRTHYDDWDFSAEGRIRQSIRMRELADRSELDFVLCDFVAPLPKMREEFSADFVIWVDTIAQGRFEDTNNMFVPPEKYDCKVTEQDSQKWATIIAAHLIKE